jgi:Rieske Fe-S protein
MNDEKADKLPRRGFLVTTGGLACSWGLAACMHSNAARIVSLPLADGALRLRIADEPELATVGGAIKLKPPGVNDTILLWRAGPTEFAATSIVCTHMGCEVEVAEGGKSLACPCHGSQYNEDGTVRHGPAERALRRYVVESDDAQITVHVS